MGSESQDKAGFFFRGRGFSQGSSLEDGLSPSLALLGHMSGSSPVFPLQVSFGPLLAAKQLSSPGLYASPMKYGTFMPELGLGRKGQMKIAATWKLRDNVTLTSPKHVQTFLSLGPDAGQLYRFLPTANSPPGACRSPGRVLLSLLPLLHSSPMVLRACSSRRQARAGEDLST